MLFLLGLLVITAACIGVAKLIRNDIAQLIAVFSVAITGLCFIIAVVAIPFTRMGERANIVRYEEFGETLKRARKNGTMTDIERAAIQKEVAGWNCWIAETRYWNGTILDIWHLDEVNDLKMLE